MANKEEEISWPYTDSPYLEIRLRSVSEEEYPLNDGELVMIDTGFSEDILVPISIYKHLMLDKWEEPDEGMLILADKSIMLTRIAKGYILIPKFSSGLFEVRVHGAYKKEQDTAEIVIGLGFIKKFKLLLDGPSSKLYIL
jgi:predicted aspartyl protease